MIASHLSTPRTALRGAAMPVLLVVPSLLLTPACGPERTGRIDPYETTYPETRSARVLPVALLEFSDQVPERLIADLQQIPTLTQRPRPQGQPITVILGDMKNQTQIVPTSDFEAMAQRIRNQLVNSSIARDRLAFVEARSRVEDIAVKERIVTRPAQGDDPAVFDTGDYQADDTLILLGDFYRISRGDVNQYYMQFQLVDAATNRIVFSDRYDVKQIR